MAHEGMSVVNDFTTGWWWARGNAKANEACFVVATLAIIYSTIVVLLSVLLVEYRTAALLLC